MLRRALSLAALGRGTAAPNPLVGAVVVRSGDVIGQGFHQRPGEPHAETIALRSVSRSANGATLYTNLEPCCHVGRTPPCVQEIERAGIVRVVASMRDPNPRVDGGGFRALRKTGVKVSVGLLRADALRLNAGFVKFTRRGLPFVTLKAAVSLDGRTATRTGDSKWITSPLARRHARLLRFEHDAILVGIETALKDAPRLTRRPRLEGASRYTRVVLDRNLRLPLDHRLVTSQGPLIVFCGRRSREVARSRHRLERLGVQVEPVEAAGGRLSVRAVLKRLAELGITRLLVEGGGEVHASFLASGLADRVVVYCAPMILGGKASLPMVGGDGPAYVRQAYRLASVRSTRVGDGWLIEGSPSPRERE
jgi:diaminohydroxyphosphoribosylaminopyrimidine deaminase/5-amino-6-(5-phosphoribosylamino)uracil reductase